MFYNLHSYAMPLSMGGGGVMVHCWRTLVIKWKCAVCKWCKKNLDKGICITCVNPVYIHTGNYTGAVAYMHRAKFLLE